MSKLLKKNAVDNGRFSLRLPAEVLTAIDFECAKRAGCVSRNTWIAEAIQEKLAKSNQQHIHTSSDEKAA